MMQNEWVLAEAIRPSVQAWLREDILTGDVSSLATISPDHESIGIIHMKDQGIVAGLHAAEEVFRQVDPQLKFRALAQDGDSIQRGDVIAKVHGSTRSILAGERLALNLLQRMSGIATQTQRFVLALDGMNVRLVDTRKTTPGHRILEKYAVRVGGGHNHRFGLYDAVMIKDNHIKAAGGITTAIQQAKQAIPHTMKVEIEVESVDQAKLAADAGADIIMLDNMPPRTMEEAVSIIRSVAAHIIIEASGGVTLQTVRSIAASGVDVISVGGLTNSVMSLDISLDLNAKKERQA